MNNLENNFKKVLEDISSGVYQKTQDIAHVSYYMLEKTAYSFHFYATYERNDKIVLAEMFYDLRNKEYYLKRNGKEVKFSHQNLDSVIPRKQMYTRSTGFNSQQSIKDFFELISVEENEGMYSNMTSGVGSLGLEVVSMTSRALIRLITEYNKLELLFKAGVPIPGEKHKFNYNVRKKFFQMVYIASSENVRKIHEVFGLTKAQYKFVWEIIGNDLNEVLNVVDLVKHLTQQDMDRYRGFIKYIEELEQKYDVERLRTFKDVTTLEMYAKAVVYKRINKRNHGTDVFTFIEEYSHTSPLRLIEYLLFECYVSQGCDYATALQEYVDYYRMCTDLEHTRFDKYPRYLRTSHDIVAMNYKLSVDKITSDKFKTQIQEYRHLETVIGDFAICVPGDTIDIINEGNMLQHCVGSYVRNVSAGKSQIMFLREKEETDVPLVTVEVKGDAITQARGFSNRSVTLDESIALRKFAKKHDLRITARI